MSLTLLVLWNHPLHLKAVNVSDPSQPRSNWPKHWLFVLCLAILQNAIAIYAVYSSSRDVLSDGACIGGVYGTLVNLLVLAVILIRAIVLAVGSLNQKKWHADISPLLVVGLSSTTAILIGQHAALRCTV
jgi:uncharacterized membrane protein